MAKTTTHVDCHGVTHVQQASSLRQQIFWSLLLASCACIGLYSCTVISIEYGRNPSATRIKLNQVDSLLLPRVTLCPSSPDGFQLQLLREHLDAKLGAGRNDTKRNLIAYLLAGFGFQKMTVFVQNWNATVIERLDDLYQMLRGNRTQMQFFTYFFDKFGYKCEQMFYRCDLGGRKINCCEHFQVTYTLRRGRCFALRPVSQRVADELGKLRLYMKKLPSLFASSGYHSNIVVYAGDHQNDIAPYPRYYLNSGYVQKMRLSSRKLSLIPSENLCWPPNRKNTGWLKGVTKGSCNIENWITTVLLGELNCSLPYIELVRNAPICQSKVVIENYATAIVSSSYRPQHACTLACERWEYTLSWEFQRAPYKFNGFSFHLAVSYTDLQYEELKEVNTITFWGFVSQIGGQIGLFLGGSLISLAQIVIVAVVYFKRKLALSKDGVAISNK